MEQVMIFSIRFINGMTETQAEEVMEKLAEYAEDHGLLMDGHFKLEQEDDDGKET